MMKKYDHTRTREGRPTRASDASENVIPKKRNRPQQSTPTDTSSFTTTYLLGYEPGDRARERHAKANAQVDRADLVSRLRYEHNDLLEG